MPNRKVYWSVVSGWMMLCIWIGGSIPCPAQSLPSLRKDMPYEQARKLLIRQGWQPSKNERTAEERGSLVEAQIKKGFVEVEDCAGTGLGLCLFVFRGTAGRTLTITTANNEPPNRSVVYGWRIE